MLPQAAARHRAMEEGPPELDTSISFLEKQYGTFKPVGPLEDIYPLATEEDREEWNPDEDDWRSL